MKKLENLSRGELKELKEELESLYESCELEELNDLINSCKTQIMNKSNTSLLDVIGKTFYYGKSETDEYSDEYYYIIKIKAFQNEEEIEDILDDDEQCTELCYEGIFFYGENLSEITEDDFSAELYGDGSITLDGDTLIEVSESKYNQITAGFKTAKELITEEPKEKSDGGIKFV